jgi:hypothetical protein
MTLGSTQPLTEINTRIIPRGKGRPARKADNLTAIREPILYKMWEPRRLITLWAPTACYGDSLAFTLQISTSEYYHYSQKKRDTLKRKNASSFLSHYIIYIHEPR